MSQTATAPRSGGLEARARAWLEERARTEEPLWLVRRRSEARGAFGETGLPDPRWEGWRHAPLRQLAALEPELSAETTLAHASVADAEALSPVEVCRLFPGAAQLPEGVTLSRLSEMAASDAAALEAHLAAHPAARAPFEALNTALFEDAIIVRIAPRVQVAQPLELVHRARPGASFPRVVVLAGEGSESTVLERFLGEGEALTCPVTEVSLEAGARLEHLRVQEEATSTLHLGTLRARLSRDAGYRSRVVSLGAGLARVEIEVRLDGEGAEADLDGLYLAGGAQHHEHHTVVDHRRPHTDSRQLYKGIVDGSAHAVFDGTVFVRRDAQRINGAQENRNLLLSEDAVVHTKPHLEIDADDVKCSHGATVGQLDERQLFYLRSRGIEADQARSILVFAFAREIIDRLEVPSLRQHLAEAVLERLPEGERVREML